MELTTKSILGGGIHPPGFQHYHPHSRIGALTAGYVRDLVVASYGRFGVGGDLTVYRVPQNLTENYGRPLSLSRVRPLRHPSATRVRGCPSA